MRQGHCHRHGKLKGPCSCGLGRMNRLVEPVILALLAREEASYGYEILELANGQPLTDSEIDAAVVYRTLRTLEEAGCVTSHWQPGQGGPQRRTYQITPTGHEHLEDWLIVLGRHADALRDFVTANMQGEVT